MISLIIGHKGSGKTKILVDAVNSATERSAGNVVCVEKANNLTYDVNYRCRLISTDEFAVEGFDAFYGFLSGIIGSSLSASSTHCIRASGLARSSLQA